MKTNYSAMRQGLDDELVKISGELQGFVRSGRKPIGVERLIEREAEQDLTPSGVFEEDIEKVSNAGLGKALALLGVAGLGAGSYALAQQSNRDRRMGKMMRIQQMQQM